LVYSLGFKVYALVFHYASFNNKTFILSNKDYLVLPADHSVCFNPLNTMSTLLQIANADRNLSSLIKGLKAADLEDSLNELGPFTIFAPINLAFGKLASGPFEDLLKPGNKLTLSGILTYHVLPSKKMLKDFRNGQTLVTVNGKEVSVTVNDGEVRINGAKILAKDRQGSNGVIHSIDAVNIPAE
jgi:uncharacterized surface protein with fasciclin (FAS1) repeats